MYICHCRAVTDSAIEAAVSSGASTVGEVAERCGAGSRCGGCWPALEAMLAGRPLPVAPYAGINGRPRRALRHHAA
ncbi:MAG: (2Fe-2S)-binding protein [Actinobacteria bacterium]|nr:(2Fe-2S)-binding protein [Actinomycetota bacterium]